MNNFVQNKTGINCLKMFIKLKMKITIHCSKVWGR